jgi:hypothetical protein
LISKLTKENYLMKSKFMKLAAAAAVSFAFAAPASAVIGSGDNASLFLEVYDTAGTNTTYIRDLGVSLLNFGTQNRPGTAGFTNILDDQATDSLVSNADATWATFISGVSAPANLRWDVVAVDSLGGSGPDLRRAVYTSLTDAVAVIAPAGTQVQNSGLNNLAGVDANIAGANVAIGAGTSGIALSSDPGYYNNGKGNTLGNSLNVALGTTDAALGQSMGFYYVTRSGASNTAELLASAYKLSSGEAFQWTLDNSGNLTYGVTVAAAVPEPSTWAMFVAGALMLGGIARRRMS